MYSEEDLEAAVDAGVIDRATVDRLRHHFAYAVRSVTVDEEHFRLITGFNDIFVSIACALLLVALGWLGQAIPIGLDAGPRPLAGVFVAGAAWELAELFTLRRRMALPSILLLIAFVGGLFVAAGAALAGTLMSDGRLQPSPFITLVIAAAALVSAGGAWLHWRRFHVPITIAAAAGAGLAMAIALLVTAVPALIGHLAWLAFGGGLILFALAMRWDISDPKRETRRSDVAFWLHLLAAPMIVHPVFAMIGLLDGRVGLGGAVAVVLLYIALGLMALVIDRRALMVSALAYVLYAISTLFREFGALSLNMALTALLLGSALLMLSAYWSSLRARVLGLLPAGWRDHLPLAERVPATLALRSA